MQRLSRALGLVVLAHACTSQPQRIERTIEPGVDPDDTEFVLARQARTDAPPRADYPIHPGEKWWPFRAQSLGISIEDAKARDAKLTTRPPEEFWDDLIAVETVSIWTVLCNECHGGRRRLQDAIEMPPPRPHWGSGESVFFGRKRPFAQIFDTITNGGPVKDGVPSEMPNWGVQLSNEQIWALIYFVEFQSSRGKEAPPSLPPSPKSSRLVPDRSRVVVSRDPP